MGSLVADGQRRIVERAVAQPFVDEALARHPAHRIEHFFVADTLGAQAVDHARKAATVRRHADINLPHVSYRASPSRPE